MLDKQAARIVELDFRTDGRLWVTVDGTCYVRVKHVEHIVIKSDDVTIAEAHIE